MTQIVNIQERLARIEQAQTSQKEQIDRVTELLERMVTMEERQHLHAHDVRRLHQRLDSIESQVQGWQTAKAVLIWIAGITAVVLSAVGIQWVQR